MPLKQRAKIAPGESHSLTAVPANDVMKEVRLFCAAARFAWLSANLPAKLSSISRTSTLRLFLARPVSAGGPSEVTLIQVVSHGSASPIPWPLLTRACALSVALARVERAVHVLCCSLPAASPRARAPLLRALPLTHALVYLRHLLRRGLRLHTAALHRGALASAAIAQRLQVHGALPQSRAPALCRLDDGVDDEGPKRALEVGLLLFRFWCGHLVVPQVLRD